MDIRTCGLVVTIFLQISKTLGQTVEGCSSYGCTPTGSFSLLTSSGLPRSGVKVIWTTQLSNSSGTGSRLLGCVSNNRHVVCPRPEGFLSLDGDTGSVLWRDTGLDSPSLPIMDVMGDVIGSDGRYLTKVDADGTVVNPVIPLQPPMVPMYSVEYGDVNILLLVSQTGELVAYCTNGIPMANLFLRGNVENYNGTFHPISQPIMNGSRAYILTQFQPSPEYTHIPREKLATLGQQRVYAVDILHRMAKIITIVWYFNLEVEVKSKCPSPSLKTKAKHFSENRAPGRGGTGTGDDRLTYSRQDYDVHRKSLGHKAVGYDSVVTDPGARYERLRRSAGGISDPRVRYERLRGSKEGISGLRNLNGRFSKNVVQMKKGFPGSRSILPETEDVQKSWVQRSLLGEHQASVLFFFGTVMVSIGPPEGQCDLFRSERQRKCCRENSGPKLWGVKDNGVNMTLLYSKAFPLSYLSVYDNTYTVPPVNKHYTGRGEVKKVGEGSLVWSVTPFGDVINGFDQITSQVQQTVDVSRMLNETVQITSRVMVAANPISYRNLLLFGVRRAKKTEAFTFADRMQVPNNYTNYLVALDTSIGEGFANVMWMLPVPQDFEVQGQISVLEVLGSNNATFVMTAKGPASQIVFAFNSTQTA